MASKHTTYFELRDALTKDGCPICRRAQDAVDGFLESMIYEKVNDGGLRQEIREARGFCNLHAGQLRDHGGALGIAIIHRDLLEALLRRVQEADYQPAGSWLHTLKRAAEGATTPAEANSELVHELLPQGDCPACRQRDEAERRNVETLVQYLDDAELNPAFRASDGLCLPHFRQALQQVPDQARFETLVEIQAAVWAKLRDELAEFIRKQDYRFRSEGMGLEKTSWIRALFLISGRRGFR